MASCSGPRSPPCVSLHRCFALLVSGLLASGSVPRSLPSVWVPEESSDGWGHMAWEAPAPRHGRTAGLRGQVEAAPAPLPPRPWLLLSRWLPALGKCGGQSPLSEPSEPGQLSPCALPHGEADTTGPGSCVPHLLVPGDSEGNLVPTFAVMLTVRSIVLLLKLLCLW